MKKVIPILICFILIFSTHSHAQGIVHPRTGTSFEKDGLKVTLISKKQNYSWSESDTRDTAIYSPKSVNFHPKGHKFYVNSLEGGSTVVYDYRTGERIKVIQHRLSAETDPLWAPSCGLFCFASTRKDSLHFMGRPVESVFTHNGRYLWVPYYRRSFDLNAQDPSAVSVIDTRTDSLIRIFETGPLPKMIAVSPDGTRLAITHWGNNTVGVMDIASCDPSRWHYTACYVVDYKLKLNFPRDTRVNRDSNSGYCLRGTVFTPDNHYLLVGCMGGGGGIAVIDLREGKYLGRVTGMMANLRHLVIDHGYLYASINNSGYIQRIPLNDFLAELPGLNGGTLKISRWESCKVRSGARTIVLSPDGRYIFAACNFSSCIAIVDARSMTLIGTIPADSYPVGLDISRDGRTLISTSQGRSNGGGNAVDIYTIEYPAI